MMKIEPPSTLAPPAWTAGAAYLYVIRLTPPQLAWEYLRRNREYREAVLVGASSPQFWGLDAFEEPSLDARSASPLWVDPRASVALTKIPDASADSFDVWRFIGAKHLTPAGTGLSLSIRSYRLRVVFGDSLRAGDPFAYVLPSSDQLPQLCLSIRECMAGYAGRTTLPGNRADSERPSPSALLHMRALQTLDGLEADASHRQLAQALFGQQRVSERWGAESELRAQVRYLVKRAQSLRDGGYRNWLTAPTSAARRNSARRRFSVSEPSGVR